MKVIEPTTEEYIYDLESDFLEVKDTLEKQSITVSDTANTVINTHDLVSKLGASVALIQTELEEQGRKTKIGYRISIIVGFGLLLFFVFFFRESISESVWVAILSLVFGFLLHKYGHLVSSLWRGKP